MIYIKHISWGVIFMYAFQLYKHCRQEGDTDQWIYKKNAEDTKGRKRTGKEV